MRTILRSVPLTTPQGSPSRYHYFATPVLLPGRRSKSSPARNYGQVAVQKIAPVDRGVKGQLQISRPTLPSPRTVHNIDDIFQMEFESLQYDRDLWGGTNGKQVSGAPSQAARTPKRQAKGRDVAYSSKNIAERAWLEEEDGPLPGETAVPRYNWRDIPVSRMSAEKAKAWRSLRRRKRRKPSLTTVRQRGEDPLATAVDSYLSKFTPLIHKEQLENDTLLEERIKQWPLERLEREGYCITRLGGYWRSATHFGKPVAVFSLGPGQKFKWHRFDTGNYVRISESTPQSDDAVTGSLIDITSTEISIAFDERFPLNRSSDPNNHELPVFRLDLWSSDIAAQRMIEAMRSLRFCPEDQINGDLGNDHETILTGTSLRDVLLHTHKSAAMSAESNKDSQESALLDISINSKQQEPFFGSPGSFSEDRRVQMWANRHRRSPGMQMEGDPIVANMNKSQLEAMALMIGNRISLIQGPPGTGKTRTIAETVKLLKVHFGVPQPILVCTYTNVAVDNLVEALVEAGVNPLRIGSPGKIKDSIAPYSLEGKMESHPLKASLDLVEDQIRRTQNRVDDTNRQIYELEEVLDDPSISADIKAIKSARKVHLTVKLARHQDVLNSKRGVLYNIKMDMLRDIVWSSDVVCTTCVTAASSALHVIDFPVVFLDEASMCTEPASLIPIMKGCEHLALIGDHMQLPPIVTSAEALSGGLGLSLFERLINEGRVPSVMLDTQYRMHPKISAFPSREFYASSLKDGMTQADVDTRLSPPASKLLTPPSQDGTTSSPVVFVNHVHAESRKDKSRVNLQEAELVCDIVEDLLKNNPNLRGSDIGIIAPYAAQITHIGRLLRDDVEFRAKLTSSIGMYRALEAPNIEVKTVDGFEGREKDVIIFSTVRNNSGGYIGFVSDKRRLNVALTRAKRALFILGNARTLKIGKVGYVEGAGLVAAGLGAGAKTVKVDVGVAIVEEGEAASGVSVKEKSKPSGVWTKYISWLDEHGLVRNVNATMPPLSIPLV